MYEWIVVFALHGFVFSEVCDTYFPRDCQDVKNIGFNHSGIYKINPVGTFTKMEVYCDMDTDDGGWLVFQRRKDGSVNFTRNWADYEKGFGSMSGEFWLGNLWLFILTQQGYYELRIDLQNWDEKFRFAKYSYFMIDSPTEYYKLSLAGYDGTAGDSFIYHSGSLFSTIDKDNDIHPLHCAMRVGFGGWWLKDCQISNLNGLYQNLNTSDGHGLIWREWTGLTDSLKSSEMKIRRL